MSSGKRRKLDLRADKGKHAEVEAMSTANTSAANPDFGPKPFNSENDDTRFKNPQNLGIQIPNKPKPLQRNNSIGLGALSKVALQINPNEVRYLQQIGMHQPCGVVLPSRFWILWRCV